MSVNQIKFWRKHYSRRRRELRPWMPIVGGVGGGSPLDELLLETGVANSILQEDGSLILLE